MIESDTYSVRMTASKTDTLYIFRRNEPHASDNVRKLELLCIRYRSGNMSTMADTLHMRRNVDKPIYDIRNAHILVVQNDIPNIDGNHKAWSNSYNAYTGELDKHSADSSAYLYNLSICHKDCTDCTLGSAH
jgi:hypothetical protein